jgi:hypothetical protein
MRWLCCILVVLLWISTVRAQHQSPAATSNATMPSAQVTEQLIYTFDVGRPVVLLDAVPDGSLWFAVDVFGVNKTITINGIHNETRYGEISALSTRLSPNGKYLIWMGMAHSFDAQSFNTTRTTIFRHDAGAKASDSLLNVESDNNTLFFSRNGDHWAAVMPSSNVKQPEPRDIAVLDGKVVASGYPNPKMFTLSDDASRWAYRSRDGRDENIIASNGKHLLYQRASADPFIVKNEPQVLRFSPDVHLYEYTLDGRDFDFDLNHVAMLYKTSYINTKHDCVLQYVVYNGKRQLYARWIKDIQISPDGNHIIYFAADTAHGSLSTNAVVVADGAIVAGPFSGAQRLFLSPKGDHTAWSVRENNSIYLYIDGKKIRRVGEYLNVTWSSDEKTIAYSTSDDHEKVYVVTAGKRSVSYDRIGRVAIASDNRSVEYLGLKYDKLVHVIQRF